MTRPINKPGQDATLGAPGSRHNVFQPVSRTADVDDPVDADYVIYRLEEAGATLLALPGTGWSTRMRSSSIEIVRTALEAYGWDAARVRPAVPSAEKIDRMDEAMAWIAFIQDIVMSCDEW